MKLMKVTCELRYLERMKLLGGYESIYRDLLGEEPEGAARWLVPGLRLDDRKRKRVMVIDPMRSVIDVEQPPNVGFCRDSILQFFRLLDDKFSIPEVSRWGLRSTWTEECEIEFGSLVAEYKQRMFGTSAMVEKANDVAAVFDYYIDNRQKLTVTTGPMQLDQLKKQFLTFEPEAIAPVFLYADVDMGDTVTREYSAKYLRDFLDRAIQEGERLATEVVNQVGVGK